MAPEIVQVEALPFSVTRDSGANVNGPLFPSSAVVATRGRQYETALLHSDTARTALSELYDQLVDHPEVTPAVAGLLVLYMHFTDRAIFTWGRTEFAAGR